MLSRPVLETHYSSPSRVDGKNKCTYSSASQYTFMKCIVATFIWSLTLREERKLRVFENMVLRRIFGPRREEVKGEWRRFHNEELNDLYCSPNIMRVIKSRRMR